MLKVLGGALILMGLTAPVMANDYVRGYYRSNGTYVQPHWRSSPDGNSYNNWSTQGNVNPYTGRAGTEQPTWGSNSGYGLYGNSGRTRRW